MSDFITPQDPVGTDTGQRLAPVNMSFMFSKTEIGLISMDVLFKEKVSFNGKVTEYPVEDGSVISDHITKGAKSLIISGTHSVAEGYSFDFASGKSRIIDVALLMQKMHDDRQLITVTTGLAVYSQLGIENMSYERSNGSPRDGNWLDLNIELKYIKKVTLRTAEVPPQQASPANGTRNRAGSTAQRTNSATNSNGSTGNAQVNNSTAAKNAYRYLQGATAR